MIEKQALTPKDVSILFGLAEGTLANWRHKKIGPRFFKLGSHKVIYFKNDLEAWAQLRPVQTIDSLAADRT